MKNLLRSILAIAVIALVMTSCQNDSVDSQKLNKNSPLTTMLLRVTHSSTAAAGKSGSEHTPCFTVNLPVSLLIAGQTVTITTMEEYAAVQNALHHCGDSDDDDDNNDNSDDAQHATFVFPITITFADGTTQVITTEAEMNTAVHSCSDAIDDIDCLDVHYPLTISFTDANNMSTVITLNNDDETYTFLATLGTAETLVIQYPLSVTDATGATVTINNNGELMAAIQAADDDCGHHEGDDDNGDDSGNHGKK